MTRLGRGRVATKLGATAILVALVQLIYGFDGVIGSVLGGFALVWLSALVVTQPAVMRNRGAAITAMAAAGFALVLVDDPSVLAWAMFAVAVSLAALLPRRRFDDAIRWAGRLAWHGVTGIAAPWRDLGLLTRVRARAERGAGFAGVAALMAMPLIGGALFLLLFASANPLIANAFATITLPDIDQVVARGAMGVVVVMGAWPMLRPAASTTRPGRHRDPRGCGLDPGVATLILSLAVFNAIFAAQNVLDIVFLWSGAALPAGVTMAEYAHQGAYALIVTALLAAAFVLVMLRPGSVGAASPAVRQLVTVWIAQNVLLVASSALRTLDYVDAYGMTILRLAALAWMALVATGLVLVAWRLLAGRSAAWLVNANALAATLVLATCAIVDMGAGAAAWNVQVALTRGRNGPPLDLCYMKYLGRSALVSLARLERHAADPGVRDRLSALRIAAQHDVETQQLDWRSWTVRNARRLAALDGIVGTVRLRPAPHGRACGAILPPPPFDLLTAGPQR